jgi:phosphate ABC transporter permease protein PstC
MSLWKRPLEKVVEYFLFFCASTSVIIISYIIYYILRFATPSLIRWVSNGFGFAWYHTIGEYGIIPFLFATVYVGFGAMLLAIPIAVPCGIYLAEYASERIRGILKPVFEMLIGIPSIIYGLIGASLIGTIIGSVFDFSSGDVVFNAWAVLAIMTIPYIATVTEDSVRAVPRELMEASLAMGATKWQTITRVIVPNAMPGILAALLLAFGRAAGETTAVAFVVGGVTGLSTLTLNPFVRSSTLTTIIRNEYHVPGLVHRQSLFGLAFCGLLMVIIINYFAHYLTERNQYGYKVS